MKTLSFSRKSSQAALLALCLLGVSVARAALPTVNTLRVDSIPLGENAVIRTDITDTDSDLDYFTVYIVGPGLSDWLSLGNINISGSHATPEQTWHPTAIGLYTVRVVAHDLSGTTTRDTTFEVFAGKLFISPVTIASGVNRIHQYDGEIVTTENPTTANVIVQSGGNLILWSGGRVTLKPGFHAQAGSFFWAAVDHDMNGYSDVEELQQNFIPGVPDAWLADHGVNLSTPISTWAHTAADYLAAYQGHYDPSDSKAKLPLPADYQLVLRTPSGQCYGVKTSTWVISPL